MGWFSRLFSKKPGGSLFGNILRKVGDFYTGGIYSAINPIMSCKTNDDGSGGLVFLSGNQIMGVSYGCGPGGYAFRGGFIEDLGGIFGGNSNTYYSPPIIPQATTVQTNNNSLFGLNLPPQIDQLLTTLVSDVTNGVIDLTDIPQSTINLIDNHLGDTMPPELAQILGVNQSMEVVAPAETFDNGFDASNSFDVNGNIGGVGFQIGNDEPEVKENAVIKWVKTTNGTITTIAVTLSLIIGGIWYYKKNRY